MMVLIMPSDVKLGTHSMARYREIVPTFGKSIIFSFIHITNTYLKTSGKVSNRMKLKVGKAQAFSLHQLQ